MSRQPDNVVQLSKTLNMCEYTSGGYKGFWLWDETRKMNLLMQAKDETEALVEALHYYQERLTQIEKEQQELKEKVAFVSQFVEEKDIDVLS